MTEPRTILVVTGLRREAGIIVAPGLQIVVSGGSRAALEGRLAQLDPSRCSRVVSFGLAGALDPELRPGDVVLASAIRSVYTRYPTDMRMLSAWRDGLATSAIPNRTAPIAGVDVPLMTASAKAALHRASGAAVVDMESHVGASFAAAHGLPFGAVRVVSDGAGRDLPPVVGRAMRPDGGIDVPALLLGLLRRPGQIPALVRTGREAGIAFRQLAAIAKALGRDFGL